MNNLNDLLKTDEKSKNYFMTLPEHIQGAMLQNINNFSSYEDIVEFNEHKVKEEQ